MLKRKSLKRYIRQTWALVEKNIRFELYNRSNLLTRFLNPILSLFVFVFLFNIIFNNTTINKLGYWNSNNFILFILIAFCIQLSRSIMGHFSSNFVNEKYWKTLSAIMIAPVNRYVLLLGGFFSELLIIFIPLGITLIIALILFPISLFFLFLVLLVFILIYLILASIGLLIGAYSVSNEKYVPYYLLLIQFIFLFSCTNYPKEVFPAFIQIVIIFNPLYYLFDLLRLVWYLGIDFETSINYITPLHIIILITFSAFTPIIAVKIFNRMYKIYGITGY